MKRVVSLEERKKRIEDLNSHLRSLPRADAMPLYYEEVVERLSSFEATSRKLQAFVRFLSKLTSKKYQQWMEKAYAGFKATISLSQKSTTTEAKETELPTAGFVPFNTPKVTKGRQKKKKHFKFF